MSDELLTILFTDVEGSTTLYSAKGDAEAREVLAAVDELARRHVIDHGGRPIKSLGDGLMAVFPSPRRAVACALAIQALSVLHSSHARYRVVSTRDGRHRHRLSACVHRATDCSDPTALKLASRPGVQIPHVEPHLGTAASSAP